jgi:integrase
MDWRCAAGQQIAGRPPEHLVFVTASDSVLRNRNARRDGFDAAVAAIGVRDLTPHGLRHTAASLAASAGANVKAVQRMLRHASATMTLDRYADLFDDDLDAVADRPRHPGSCGHGSQKCGLSAE